MNQRLRHLPSISVLMPTLNAARTLEKCLRSIANQDYLPRGEALRGPKEKIEIIVADGGSSDNTLSIVRKFKVQNSKFKVKIAENPLKTGEAGKAVALRHAQGELVALIDSDNLLPDKDWFQRMVEPFSDPEISGSEPWEFTYRKDDSLVNRYCALIGANDPYCYFIGNYDKKSVLSGKWTGLALAQKEKSDYLKVKIEGKVLPTIGANGTIWRREVLKRAIGSRRYLFDTDVPYLLAKNKPFWFAKVKIGIVHLYCPRLRDFYRKQKRRAQDFFHLEDKKERQETYQRQLTKQLAFVLATIFVFPLVIQAIKGYIKKPERAWFFHPFACLITLWLYGSETFLTKLRVPQIERKGWHQ